MYARFPVPKNLKQDWHVLPVNDLVDHTDTGRECVCSPSYYFICDCEDGEECWKCDDGKIAVDVDYHRPVMVVHNAFDGRE